MARDDIGEESYADFKKYDVGDILGMKGDAIQRQKQVRFLSMRQKLTLLSKSLQVLPEKFHGLTDTDTRYRQRYVDLIMNHGSQKIHLSNVPRFSVQIRKYSKRTGIHGS